MSIAIRTEHLSKEYRLGTINHGMLFRDIQSWMARRAGRPDPHEKIGAAHYEDQSDRFWALKDVTFDIEQGDRIGIIGRNGAGKSTLLKILSRITAPTEGIVKIKGRVVSLLEVGTGFHPELTGRENIFLNGAILGMKKRQVARKMEEIISFSEIEKFIDTPVKRYSSGMYVRLAFAVAAHLDSDILLADEVLAVGDSTFQKKCLGKMDDVSRNQGRTVVFVSHNMAAISELCLSGVLLDKGAVVSKGKISDVIDQYLFNNKEMENGQFDLSDEKIAKRRNSLDQSRFKWLRAEIIDSSGSVTSSIYCGEPFSLLLTGKSECQITDLDVGIGISSNLGFSLFNTHSSWEGIKTEYQPGEITFKITFEQNLIAPGSYIVDLGANGSGVVDWIPNAFTLVVKPMSLDDSKVIRANYSGVVMHPCKWQIL